MKKCFITSGPGLNSDSILRSRTAHIERLVVDLRFNNLGPVVQNFVSLTSSLSPQLVK